MARAPHERGGLLGECLLHWAVGGGAAAAGGARATGFSGDDAPGFVGGVLRGAENRVFGGVGHG